MLKAARIKQIFMILSFISLACPVGAQAHEHWLEISSFYPAAGSEVEVAVCSGHDYPGSVFALKDEVSGQLIVSCPGGNILSLETVRADKTRTTRFDPAGAGVYLLRVELKRPKMEKPAYEMKAIMIAGGEVDDPALYSFGKGLEIVPLDAVSLLSAGGEMRLQVLMDGEAVPSQLEVIPAEGRTGWYKASPGQPAEVRIECSGRYLVTTSISGRGCSLVLEIGGGE